MQAIIRLAKKSDLKEYTFLLSKTFQKAYVSETDGLTKELWSQEIFSSQRMQEKFKSRLVITNAQKTWMTVLDGKLVGSISMNDEGTEYELRGFYVDPEYQGHGIGKQLWSLAKGSAKGKDIILDTYAHNHKTIEMYKKWGFEVDTQKGIFYAHYPEWPKDIQAKNIYMRLRKSLPD